MVIDLARCVGCEACTIACKVEHNVPIVSPRELVRRIQWTEVYFLREKGKYPHVNTEIDPRPCMHCENPPCVAVCPVGATYQDKERGLVLQRYERCIGCRYCTTACPYGARYMHPVKHVADKCTFCYHRITKGLLPACVEVCPTQARIFGEADAPQSPIRRFMRFNDFRVLKPELNTAPMVFYAGAGKEVR